MGDKKIEMVNLTGQYYRLKQEIDEAMRKVLESSTFINGPQVKTFAEELAGFLGVKHVITCANGTDALQIALMALDLRSGDEVIVPAFSYAAAAESVALLGLSPVFVDVDPCTFNIDPVLIEDAITEKTRAIIAVHLFGQSCDMASLSSLAEKHGLYLIEDNAQSLGATCRLSDNKTGKAGTIGHIGTTSFFPSKPLGCYGDGGAMMTNDDDLAERCRMIASHGQKRKYHHELIGCNSRLDTIQAAILSVKLKYMDSFTAARQAAACLYDEAFDAIPWLINPKRTLYSSHVYHQYTLRVSKEKRDGLKSYLSEKGIPSMVYYPLSLTEQEAFKPMARIAGKVEQALSLSRSVLSIPIHTEMREEEQHYIIETIQRYE